MDLHKQCVRVSTGITLNVYHAGVGPDVLLLHGTAGSTHDIRQLVEAGFRVTIPDGRGHGTTVLSNQTLWKYSVPLCHT